MNEETQLTTLSTPMNEIASRIQSEDDINELKNIINIFNLNIQKKNIIRASKLTDLQDLVAEQMEERLTKRAGEFSNQDLLTYFKTIQDTISKSDTTLNNIDVPAIQVTQNQLNINLSSEPKLDRTSKEHVLEAIKAILSKEAKDTTIDANIIEEEEIINE